MKKQGTVKIYKKFPDNSLSYKLEKLQSTKNLFYSSLAQICVSPLMTGLYITIGSVYEKGWIIGCGAAIQALHLASKISNIVYYRKQLKQLKYSISEDLSLIEPTVITNEEDKKTLVKRI